MTWAYPELEQLNPSLYRVNLRPGLWVHQSRSSKNDDSSLKTLESQILYMKRMLGETELQASET